MEYSGINRLEKKTIAPVVVIPLTLAQVDLRVLPWKDIPGQR